MPRPIEEREEILVTDDNIEKLKDLRKLLIKEFPRCWWYLHFDTDPEKNVCGIEVANVWGGRLSEEQEDSIRAFIFQYMVDSQEEK